MSPVASGSTDETTFEDLADSLKSYADRIQPEKGQFKIESLATNDSEAPAMLRRAAIVVRHHAHNRAVLDTAHYRVKIVGAIVTALFAAATALVGQSSGWAANNLGLAYGLLIGGTVVAGVAGGFAVYLGLADPTKGQLVPPASP